jgi:membrane-associated phospholipid phosphatase
MIVERGFSFPSGHSMLGMAAWGIAAVVVGRSRLPPGVRLTAVAGVVVLIGLIGLSRVYLGVHYPTDVVAGWLAGGVGVLVFAHLTRPGGPEAEPVSPGGSEPDA